MKKEERESKKTLLEPVRSLDKFVFFPVFNNEKKLRVASNFCEDFKHFPVMPEFLKQKQSTMSITLVVLLTTNEHTFKPGFHYPS